MTRAALAVLVLTLGAAGGLGGSGCAKADLECNFHSQCGDKHYCDGRQCRQDCMQDFDCTGGKLCNQIGQCTIGGITPDGGVQTDGGTQRDGSVLPVDAAVQTDGAVQPGQGRYLDRCTGAGDCQSALCVPDFGGTMMCTRSCTQTSECAHRHVCANQRCVPDDTGRPCQLATPATCVSGLCLGNTTGATPSCTRNCASAADCPAGFACTMAGGQQVCADIERACSTGDQCATGLCLTVQGCTATCRTASDCPERLDGLPPYTCAIAFGSSSPICVPPSDIPGPDPAGALCRAGTVTGTTLCRSGACDDAAPGGAMCTQSCRPAGGCPPGLGCFPLADAGSITFVCSRAGTRSLGASCANGRDCDSGLCDATSSRCTRLCNDGLCPTSWRCETIAGFNVSICRP